MSEIEQYSPFRPISTFFPPINSSCLTAFTNDVEKLFDWRNKTAKRHTIQWLQDNDDLVVIRTADKGGAVVVWGKTQCIVEAINLTIHITILILLSIHWIG